MSVEEVNIELRRGVHDLQLGRVETARVSAAVGKLSVGVIGEKIGELITLIDMLATQNRGMGQAARTATTTQERGMQRIKNALEGAESGPATDLHSKLSQLQDWDQALEGNIGHLSEGLNVLRSTLSAAADQYERGVAFRVPFIRRAAGFASGGTQEASIAVQTYIDRT